MAIDEGTEAFVYAAVKAFQQFEIYLEEYRILKKSGKISFDEQLTSAVTDKIMNYDSGKFIKSLPESQRKLAEYFLQMPWDQVLKFFSYSLDGLGKRSDGTYGTARDAFLNLTKKLLVQKILGSD